MGTDHQVLHDKVAVAFEPGAWRYFLARRDNLLFVNLQLCGFTFFIRSRTLACAASLFLVIVVLARVLV
jgi:hypothetical protein